MGRRMESIKGVKVWIWKEMVENWEEVNGQSNRRKYEGMGRWGTSMRGVEEI